MGLRRFLGLSGYPLQNSVSVVQQETHQDSNVLGTGLHSAMDMCAVRK